jgi:hypothetical protein
LHNARTPDVVAKGPSIARHYSSRNETPFVDIDLSVRPADVPAAQRLRSLKPGGALGTGRRGARAVGPGAGPSLTVPGGLLKQLTKTVLKTARTWMERHVPGPPRPLVQ